LDYSVQFTVTHFTILQCTSLSSLSAESLLGWAQDLLQTQLFSEDWLTQSPLLDSEDWLTQLTVFPN
jgi:hypothetical protein